MLIRFTLFYDKLLLDRIRQFILNKLNTNNFCDFTNIITNMLNIEYNKRLSFEEIKIFFENKLLEINE